MELFGGVFLTAYCLYVGTIAGHGIKVARGFRNFAKSTTAHSTSSSSSDDNETPTTARYNGPTEAEMTAEQRTIRDDIVKTRPRTGLSGPFGPWLAVPAIARPSQELGAACRYGTSLSFRESELIILLTGAFHQSTAEFDIHVPEALRAGHSQEWIDNIPRGSSFNNNNNKKKKKKGKDKDEFNMENVQKQVLSGLETERERAIGRFAAELLIHSKVSDETYAETKRVLAGSERIAAGDSSAVLVEITSIVGYYTYVAYTLNVFQIPAPPSS